MGGEEFRPRATPKSLDGLPPRGRGRGGEPAKMIADDRITPAWAGKSAQQLFLFLVFRDYPRVGGEEAC